MSGAPKRIVVVDDEPHIRQMLGRLLPAPEFEVHLFADARDALMKLHDLLPDLIICDVMMPEMDGRTFLKVVKRSQFLRDVPFIFLSALVDVEEVVQAYEVGADDFVEKPFDLARLMAKVRAMLRMAERRRSDALSGPIGSEGTLPLLKFCEDNHLTGRLTLFGAAQERWVEFLGGEVMRAGGTPEDPELDALDALLAMQSGSYRIEQRRLDRRAVEEALARHREGASGEEGPAPPTSAGSTSPPAGLVAPRLSDDEEADAASLAPEGRLARVMVRGREVQVQTEAANRPQFTITTIVAREGQVLRKIESAWQHALKRREDQELARAHIERQHERVICTLRELGREDAAPGVETGEKVDPTLLAWAVSFVGEQARHHLGAVMAVALLRRTLKAALRQHAVLRSFRVAEDGRVLAEAGAAVESEAVAATADWTAAFVRAASELVERMKGLRLRALTRMMEPELERVGFYAAYEAALARG